MCTFVLRVELINLEQAAMRLAPEAPSRVMFFLRAAQHFNEFQPLPCSLVLCLSTAYKPVTFPSVPAALNFSELEEKCFEKTSRMLRCGC